MSLRKFAGHALPDKDIRVQELTTGDIVQLIEMAEADAPHVLDFLVESPVNVRAVMMSTGLTEEEIMNYAPSDLEPLYQKVVDVNPLLVAAMERLKNVIEKYPEIRFGKQPASS